MTPPTPGWRVEVALDGGLLEPLTEPWAAPAEGSHWLTVVSRDLTTDASQARWIRLQVDAAPPRVQLSLDREPVADDDGALWVAPGATATARADDALAGVSQLTLDVDGSSKQARGDEVSLPLPSAGTVQLEAWAEDRVGNRSPRSELRVGVDGQPPQGEILLRAEQVVVGGVRVVSPRLRVEAQVSDGESGLATWTRWVEEEPVDEAGWVGPWASGLHTVSARATDRVGNQASLGPVSFLVDGSGPEITWTVSARRQAGSEGAPIFLPPVSVQVATADQPAGTARVEWSSDGTAWRPVDGPLELSEKSVRLRAVDRVGNLGEATARWRLDDSPPEVRLTAEAGELIGPGSEIALPRDSEVYLAVSDEGSGVGSAEQRIDGAPWQPLSDLVRFERKGTFHLRVRAEDLLGNEVSLGWKVVVP